MAEHRWSGWPGAWCLDCGVEDAGEICITDHDVLEFCVEGHNLCTEHPTRQCDEHRNGPCPEPGSHRHDPYHHATKDPTDEA